MIAREVAILDPEKFGKLITLCVEVHMDSSVQHKWDSAKRKFASIPEVQQCYQVTGEADLFLVVVIESMEHYSDLCRRIFYGNNNVKWFRTMVVMERTKVTLNIPIK